MQPRWRKYKNYAFVLPLCAAALFYQITASVAFVEHSLHQVSTPDLPFYSSAGEATVISKAAQSAGMHEEDRITALDRKPLNNDIEFYEDMYRHKPGDMLMVTEKPKDQTSSRTFGIRIPSLGKSEPTASTYGLIILLLIMTLGCVLIGIYVAVRCPWDKRALLVFSLMLSLSQGSIGIAPPMWFPEPLWIFATAWQLACGLNMSIAIAAFGLYFPEQFAWDKERPWVKWIYLGPLISINLFILLTALIPLFSYRAYQSIAFLATPLARSVQILIAISITIFFICMGAKQRRAKNADAKRRLGVLELGAIVGLTPIGLLLLYQILMEGTMHLESAPKLVLIGAVVLFFAFPIGLAYAVLTERALDLRVVLRLGMRYALARNGIRVLFAIFGIIFFTVLSNALFKPGVSDVVRAVGTSLGVTVFVVLLRRIRSQAFVAVDKKFFREQYQAEAVLSDLSEHVRSIVDEKQLLETVSRRISDALHVAHFAVLMNVGEVLRPLYCLGLAIPTELQLPVQGKIVELLESAKEPAPIYFDRQDNWVYQAPESELATLKALGAQLLLPLKAKASLLGLFCLGPKLSEEPFSKTDVNLLRSVALQTGLALDNSRLTNAFAREVAQRERLNREIEIAREVQERLFPQQLPEIQGIDYYGACRPALGVGGDYYDFLKLANGEFGVAIGDVSGKGIAAALLMASLQASLRGQALSGLSDLAQLMSNVNRLVCDATTSNRYATFFYGQYNPQTREFRYVNAGHNAPFVLRRGKNGTSQVIRLSTGGPVVGLMPDIPYQQGSLLLEPGDVFIGFTDGISEAMNPAEEEWGEEHFIPAAVAQLDKPAAQMIPRLMAEADRFANGAPQHDDMTLVILKMQPHLG